MESQDAITPSAHWASALSVASAAAADTLNVATFNCRNGVNTNSDRLLTWAAAHHLHVVGVTEPGTLPAAWPNIDATGDHPLWHVIRHDDSDGKVNRAMLMLHTDVFADNIIEQLSDPSGRAVGAIVRGGSPTRPSHTLIACAYMPKGLDIGATADENKEADRLHSLLLSWSVRPHVRTAIIMGDFNETRSGIDRRTSTPIGDTIPIDPAGTRSDARTQQRGDGVSRIAHLCGDAWHGIGDEKGYGDGNDHHFIDAFRECHETGGFTCRTATHHNTYAESRIDLVLFRDTRGTRSSSRIRACVAHVHSPPPLPSDHFPVLIQLMGDFDFKAPSTATPPPAASAGPPLHRLLSMGRITDDQKKRAVESMEKLISGPGLKQGSPPILALLHAMRTNADADNVTVAIVQAAQQATASWPLMGSANSDRRPRIHRWFSAYRQLRARLIDIVAAVDNGTSDEALAVVIKEATSACTNLLHRIIKRVGPVNLDPGPGPGSNAETVAHWAKVTMNRLRHVKRDLEFLHAQRRMKQWAAGRGRPTHDYNAPDDRQPRSMDSMRRDVYGARAPPLTAITTTDGKVLADPKDIANEFAKDYAPKFAATNCPRSSIDEAPPADIDQRGTMGS
jgi:exonuclease III